jgi:hypothetical protein
VDDPDESHELVTSLGATLLREESPGDSPDAEG